MNKAYFQSISDKTFLGELKKLLHPSKDDENIAVRRGYNMAFGAFSRAIIEEIQHDLIPSLLENCKVKGKENDDAETRKYAVRSLLKVIKTAGFDKLDFKLYLPQIVETFYKAMDDYAVDRRGDVGSWVREEAMGALRGLISFVLDSGN